MARNVEFDILARDRASKTFDRVGKASDGLSSKLGSVGKALAGGAALAAVGGIAALGVAMVQGVKDAASYQTLALKTAAVLKSTGNVAHQSVKGIQARAAALESLSGVDETVIINGQNVLATFTRVRDGVGKGNDVFNQATTAALNMSVALGTDLQGATLQVGKALNDPIKGITALRRAGVSFDAQQIKTIKTMVKTGNTLGAQKIILGELTKEFGGAAKAAGKGFEGSMARAKDAVQDAFRAIGMKLLPTLTKLADYAATHAGPFIDKLSAAFSKVWGWVANRLWPALQKGYQTIMPGVRQALSILKGGVDGNSVSWKQVGDVIVNKVIPFLAGLARVWIPMVATNLRIIIEVVKAVWRVFQTMMTIVGGVIVFLLRRFADLSSMWAGVLRALSHIPGFGWAKGAADKMQAAADKARALARAIELIPKNKTVTVNTYFKTHGNPNPTSTNGSGAGVKGYAVGGTNLPRGWKIVGEQGPELMWTPGGDTVIPSRQTKQMLKGGGSGSAMSGGGDVHIHIHSQGIIGSEDQVMRLVQQGLLKLKRQGGVNLGLA